MNGKMPFRKCEVFIVALATVCCVCLHGKGSHALKELKELDLAILEHELLQNYEPESRTDEEDGTVNVNSNESSVFQQADKKTAARCVDALETIMTLCPMQMWLHVYTDSSAQVDGSAGAASIGKTLLKVLVQQA
ncbi:hypothetical protein TNIN_295231 [Trichonephila inaurata madagascariensis]|uniref:Uncharacterized protein n=1 Tax=Trichonephila inaurata madagascariensis TaxID=2747483 RepID=A0A8X7BRM6_9ARAC|nr:hypothetical protein TNIN_295231 [Trichonephila inaurata madagascariensis]